MAAAELVALHIRVIALENLVIFLLAAASDQQLELAREMAPYISPRPGFTPHPLTTHAVVDMIDLLERASRSCGTVLDAVMGVALSVTPRCAILIPR
jgi:hypothetical protein